MITPGSRVVFQSQVDGRPTQTSNELSLRPPSGLRRSWPVVVSWTLATILLAAVAYGLLVDTAYRVAPDLAVASQGQDVLTLVAIPLLIWASYRSRAGALRGHLTWLGVLAYVAYSYLVYAIGLPQNDASCCMSALSVFPSPR